jgi:hypothetical protein
MLTTPWCLNIPFSEADAKRVEKDVATGNGLGSVENKTVCIGSVKGRTRLMAVAYVDLTEGAMYYRQRNGRIHANGRPFRS